MNNKTQNLEMIFMSQSQNKKEDLFNECIMKLDAIHSCIMNDPINGDKSPPINAAFGLYVISSNGANGDWQKYSGYLAYYIEGWKFIKPWTGMMLFREVDRNIYVFYHELWNKYLPS
jgi:hypothetical protein